MTTYNEDLTTLTAELEALEALTSVTETDLTTAEIATLERELDDAAEWLRREDELDGPVHVPGATVRRDYVHPLNRRLM